MLHIEGGKGMWKKVFMQTAVIVMVGLIGSAQAGVKSLTVKVDGLACSFCAFGLEKKLKRIEGVETLDIAIDAGEVVLNVSSGALLNAASGANATASIGLVAQVQNAVEEGGFTPRSLGATVEGEMVSQNGETRLRLSGTGESLVLEESGGLEELRTLEADLPVQVAGELLGQSSPRRFRITKIVTAESAGVVRRLKIAGLACMGCVEAIRADLEQREGIESVRLELESGVAEIVVADQAVTVESLAELVKTLGMEGMPAGTFTATALQE